MRNWRILVVEDDTDLRESMSLLLSEQGYDVQMVATGGEGLQAAQHLFPDLIILDVQLPDAAGFDVVQDLRRFSGAQVLMMSGSFTRGDDIVSGLDRGADDYVTKPFKPDELLARVRARLRRQPPDDARIVAADSAIEIDRKSRTVWAHGNQIDLTPTEYDLLVLLAEHRGEVLGHRMLLREVWGVERAHDTDYLKVYIWHLRRKLELDPAHPTMILTEWGVGYRLAP